MLWRKYYGQKTNKIERTYTMTANEANKLASDANVLTMCLNDVYDIIEATAKRGNYELLFSGIPINLVYTEWDMLKHNPNLVKDFIEHLANQDGYIVVNNSDERSVHKTITIRWN